MRLFLKSVTIIGLFSTLAFSQTGKKAKKLARKAQKNNCPVINGSYTSCKITKMNINLEGVGKAFYDEMAEGIEKFWEELPEEVQENLGITKQQFIWVEILRKFKVMPKDTPTTELISIGSSLNKESFTEIYDAIITEIKKVMKSDIESTRKKEVLDGEYDIMIETSWIDRKIQYSDNAGTYKVGEKSFRDEAEFDLTCESEKAIFDGELKKLIFSLLPSKDLLIQVQENQLGIKENLSIRCQAE